MPGLHPGWLWASQCRIELANPSPRLESVTGLITALPSPVRHPAELTLCTRGRRGPVRAGRQPLSRLVLIAGFRPPRTGRTQLSFLKSDVPL